MKNFTVKKTYLIQFSCILFWLLILPGFLQAEGLTLEMIFKFNLFIPDFGQDIYSMNDGLHYTVLENSKDIVKYSTISGNKEEVLFSADWYDELKNPGILSYNLNENETVILISTDEEKIYRYSYMANYFVYIIPDKKLIPVYTEGKQQYTKVSPDGQRVAFIFENNLYIKDLPTHTVTQITHDGLKNSVIYGAPDWLYEEEFGLKTGYYWSPDSRMLAYYRFDESFVKEYPLIFYESSYPDIYTYKYPKAGENNSLVDIYTYDLSSGVTQKMLVPEDSDKYIPSIQWVPESDQLCVTCLNRLQNKADLYVCDAATGKSEIFYTEQNNTYISGLLNGLVTFTNSGRYAIILSARDGFKHLYLYDLNGQLINQITSGNWEVEEFYGFDESTGRLYYTSTEASPLERHLYSIKPDGSDKIRMTHVPGTHSASFTRSYNYYILTSSDAQTPYNISLFNRKGELIRVLEDNAFITGLTSKFNFSRKEFFTFRNSNNTELNGFKILPPDFKKNKKYPVLIYVYGGPESQTVKNTWDKRLAWFQLLAQKGYIVVCTDNRGTDGKGEEFRKATYLKLGQYEVEDQIALAEYLSELSYIDKNRIGIFGWSYGGYISLLCMTKGNHIFKTGIAVAPVTDWKFYDTVYTERYMQKPDDNKEGYRNSSPLNFLDRLEGKFLLIHGLADDNVHFQHSAELLKSLKEENKSIDMYIYPNENHLMRGYNALYHVYCQATEYIVNNL